MAANSGSIRKLVLNGVTYDVPGASNFTFNLSSFETEGIPTSGKTMFKMTRRVPTIEGVEIIATPAEAENLRVLSEGLADITIAIELADGSVFRGTGKVNFESFETEEHKCSLTLIPARTGNAWTAFTA
jgi:hypothetical protein